MQNNENNQPLFISEEWISGESCLFTITNIFEHSKAKNILMPMRKKFMNQLQNEGFEIVTDRKNVPDNAFYLTMNDFALCNDDIEPGVWKKLFDKKVFESGGEKFNYPRSLTMEEYFSNPFFPAVFKNEIANGGKDKFLIETPNQLEIIKSFYNDFINDSYYKQIFDLCIFQQFIETPTNYKTYMRVLMGASGDVMGASLKYSLIKRELKQDIGDLEEYFSDANSKYFLDSKSMFGYYSGGGNISFSQPRYSYEKKEILKAHNIDSDNPKVPDDVLEVSQSIVQNCHSMLGVICGIDFIYNINDGKWYYLELQAFPAIDEWADVKRIKLPKRKDLNGYLELLEIELEARHEALTLLRNKKIKNKSNR